MRERKAPSCSYNTYTILHIPPTHQLSMRYALALKKEVKMRHS